MKKIVALLLTVVMALGCVTLAVGEKQESGIIAVCLPTLDNPLMLSISENIQAAFPDKDVQVASANSDPNTQAQQVQNYITMNADMIVCMAVEVSSLVDVLKEARAAGIKVFVNGAQVGDPDAYDCVATVNQYLVGQYCALMAKNWVEKNYPDAADGSIPCAVLASSLNEDAVARTTGLLSIAEPYRKNVNGEFVDDNNNVVAEADAVPNPVYCPKIAIAVQTQAEMFQAGQVAMQNILTTNPDVKVILAYASDGGSGASQAVMDAGFSPEELAKMAIFGCGVIGPEEQTLIDTEAGNGIFRGAVAFGGKDLGGEMAALAQKVLAGEGYEKDSWDAIAMVYAKNGEAVRVEVNNIGAVQAVNPE